MFETGLDRVLEARIAQGALQINYPSGLTRSYGDGTGRRVAVRLADPATVRAIAIDPGLGVAEAYMDGRLILEIGDIYDLIAIAKSNMRTEGATPGARLQHLRRRLTRAASRRVIRPGRARANVAHHYDLDERLYRLFLDEDMQYSCGYFEEPGLALDQAQLAKKRLIAAKLLVRPGARVLDIGSGWGGMALYLAQVCGADVTGITLSEEQLRVAIVRAERLGLADRVRFRLQDYRAVSESFDNIVSVGMFEHVGQRHYRSFFARAAEMLEPDGVMLLHSMALPEPGHYNHPFFDKYIFPDGFIPAMSDVMPAVEASGLLTRDVEILSLHYAETTKAWRERFHAQRAAVLDLYDERFFRMWDFYLAGSEAVFRYDGVHVFHLQLAHDQDRVPRTRDYIAPTMAALRQRETELTAYAHLNRVPERARPRQVS